MSEILLLKVGALGDVLRTTSILPGLRRRYPDAPVHWVSAPEALDLVRRHPDVDAVHAFPLEHPDAPERLAAELAGRRWRRILSFDDEEPVGRLAGLLRAGGDEGVLTGAYLDPTGRMRYTPDSAPWFDMGLLSVHGKEEADRRKRANRRSHAAILADILGIEPGEPRLDLPGEALAFAAGFVERAGPAGNGPLVGLNTGAGGRWESKRLPVERTAELAVELTRRRAGRITLLLLGGAAERARNDAILAAAGERARLVDAGTENSLLEFAALIDRLDLLVTSDSLALHVAIARHVPVVPFFAPTSPAEIDLHGRGEKVASLAPDACSYRPDADTSTITVERLAAAVERVLSAPRPRRLG